VPGQRGSFLDEPSSGAIIDELRAIDWIPRSVRFEAREVEKAYVALENRLHRSPTDAEVAQRLGITTDGLHQIFNQISFVSVVALDELLPVGSERGDRLSLVDTWRTRAPRTRWPCSSPRR
jgi:RNA polymerase sigma factor FliA